MRATGKNFARCMKITNYGLWRWWRGHLKVCYLTIVLPICGPAASTYRTGVGTRDPHGRRLSVIPQPLFLFSDAANGGARKRVGGQVPGTAGLSHRGAARRVFQGRKPAVAPLSRARRDARGAAPRNPVHVAKARPDRDGYLNRRGRK